MNPDLVARSLIRKSVSSQYPAEQDGFLSKAVKLATAHNSNVTNDISRAKLAIRETAGRDVNARWLVVGHGRPWLADAQHLWVTDRTPPTRESFLIDDSVLSSPSCGGWSDHELDRLHRHVRAAS